MKLETTSSLDLLNIAEKLNIHGLTIESSDTLDSNGVPDTAFGIINLDDSQGSGSHWVAFYNHPKSKYTIYYDSFGSDADPRTIDFLKKSGNPVIGVSNHTQDLSATSCGWYCLCFLYDMKQTHGNIGKFLSRFGGDEKKNEAVLRNFFKKQIKNN